MALKIDSEFQALLPPQDDREREQLESNIVRDGRVYQDILTWNGVIVDGYNRYEIARDKDLPYKTRKMDFKDREEAKRWIISNQLGRRNLDQFGKANLRSMLVDAKVEAGKTVTEAVREVAETEGVSVSTINKDRKVAREAPKRSTKPASKREAVKPKESSNGSQKAPGKPPADPAAREGKLNRIDAEVKTLAGKLIRLMQDRGKLAGPAGKSMQRACHEKLGEFSALFRRWRGEK